MIRDYLPGQLVVGLPYNDDGTPTGTTLAAQTFATALAERCKLPVALVDERHADVDMTAAKVVLERWFSQGSTSIQTVDNKAT